MNLSLKKEKICSQFIHTVSQKSDFMACYSYRDHPPAGKLNYILICNIIFKVKFSVCYHFNLYRSFFSVKLLTAAVVPLLLTAKIGRTVVSGLIISSLQQITLITGQTPMTQTALFSITMETGFWEAMGCR